MTLANKYARSDAIKVYAVLETTSGTLEQPSASNAIELAEDVPTYSQQGQYFDLNKIRTSRTKFGRVFTRMDYGTFSGLKCFASPSSTAGTAPDEGDLLKFAFGSEATSSTVTNTVSGITQANPAVITVTGTNGFKAGDRLVVTAATETDYNVTYNVVSVSGATITTDVDASAFGAGAASDGTATLNLVRYELVEELPTFSLYIYKESGFEGKKEPMITAMSGCYMTNIQEASISKSGVWTWDMSGEFYRAYYGGSANISGTVSDTATTITIATLPTGVDALTDIFYVGERITLVDTAGTVTIGGAGYVTISDVGATTLTTDAITVASGPFPTATTIVQPYVPTPTAWGTNVVNKRNAQIYLGTANSEFGTGAGEAFVAANAKPALSGTFSLAQATLKPGAEEMDGQDYPAFEQIVDDRDVSGSFTIILRPRDQGLFKELQGSTTKSLGFEAGTGTGLVYKLYMPKVDVEIPELSVDNEGADNLTINYMATEPATATSGLGAEGEVKLYIL